MLLFLCLGPNNTSFASNYWLLNTVQLKEKSNQRSSQISIYAFHGIAIKLQSSHCELLTFLLSGKSVTECTLYGIIPDWYVFNIVVDLLNVSFAQLSTEYLVRVCGFVVA